MIPCEILKKFRQIEMRPNRSVNHSIAQSDARIPAGFRPRPDSSAMRGIGHNPDGVEEVSIPFTQGSSCVATLGWRTQSLWDCLNRIVKGGTGGAQVSARFGASEIDAPKTAGTTIAIGRLERRERRAPAASFQPSLQFRGISRIMPKGGDYHFGSLAFDDKKDGIGPRFWKPSFASQATDEAIAFRILADCPKEGAQVAGKSLSQSRLPIVVEVDRGSEFPFRFLFNDRPKTHRTARNRFSMSATTSSSGRQSSGCVSARSARRSSSAICSGVSASSNFSRRCSKTSRCSSKGSLSTCSMTCVALMTAIYPVNSPAQAGFSQSRIKRQAFRAL